MKKNFYNLLLFLVGMTILFYLESIVFKTKFLLYRPIVIGLAAYCGYYFIKK